MNDICHITMPHHVLNAYYFKQFIVMTLGVLVIFFLNDWNINYKVSHIFEDFY